MSTKSQHARRYQNLPKLLKSLREDAGLTQRSLGDRLKRPHSWVYNCETGNRRVDLAEFCDWCNACDLDPIAGVRRFLRR